MERKWRNGKKIVTQSALVAQCRERERKREKERDREREKWRERNRER